MGKTFLRGLACSVSAVSMAALLAPAAAVAQQAIYQFNIPAQDLGAALRAYGQASGQQIMFEGRDVRGKQSTALVGGYSAEDGLRRLLEGTGLQYARSQSGVLLVQDPASPTRLGGDERAAANEFAEEEVLVVTGTRIRGIGSAPSPVYSFDREDFAQQGADSAQEVLRNLPQNFTGGASEQAAALSSTRNGNNFNLGYGASVNLRGLGTASTLVLLNGRRLAPGGLGNFVDISTIPLSAVERIEAVPDGASAVYGSDAVGGVVNFILRDNFQGAETQVRYAGVTDGSLRQFSFNQIAGTQWNSGSVLVNFDYGRSEPLLASERPFATGLQNGVTYLSPSNERTGVLINAHQDLSPTLRLNALVQGGVRDVENRVYQTSSGGRQNAYEGATDQVGGTLSLDWRASDTWTLTLARSEHRNTTVRDNYLGASSTVAANTTQVRATYEVSATELEGEGVLFNLPGGAARLAIGAEQREETLEARRVNVAGSGQFLPLQRDVAAGYAELFVPIFGEANAAPFAERLNFTLAARYEDYSDVGAADTYKFGVLWAPFDGVDLRATYGTSFRAPFLYQYDRSLSQGVVQNVGGLRLAYILNAPAPDLGPENATTWSAGFDIDQDLLGVRVTATYFDVAYEDRIGAGSPSGNVFIIPAVAALVSVPADPEVLAAVAQATTITNVSGQPLSAAQATFDGRTHNQGETNISGVDLTLDRRFDAAFGTFSLGVNASYLTEYETQALPTAPMLDVLDTIYNPADLRARAYLTWALNGWSVAAFVNYTDEYTDNQLTAAPVKVSSWTTLDLNAGYRFDDDAAWLGGVSIRLNAQNILDEDPPRIIDRGSSFGSPGYDTENANPIGRLVSLTVSKSW